MANSISEAVAEAIAEIELKDWVIDATEDTSVSESKPGNYLRKRLNVLHQTRSGEYTYSGKEFYINLSDFTYLWKQGGATVEPVNTPYRNLLESKETGIKNALGVEWVEITECDEILESGIVQAISGTTNNNADTLTIKTWKIDADTVGWKITDRTTVS